MNDSSQVVDLTTPPCTTRDCLLGRFLVASSTGYLHTIYRLIAAYGEQHCGFSLVTKAEARSPFAENGHNLLSLLAD